MPPKSPPPAAEKRGPRLRTALLLALLAAALAGRSWRLSAKHRFPVYDEVETLELARGIAREGGSAAAIASHLTGRYQEENRNPLYLMALAPFMDASPEDFARAKLLSLACAWLLILTVFLMSRRVWGESAALAAAAAAALSPVTAEHAQYVGPDWLFAAVYFAAIAVLAGWHKRAAAWPLFGFLAGTAYLAKGNGHFLLLSAVAVGLSEYGPRFFLSRRPYAAVAGFAAGAWFLLWRNLLVWGTPFHQINEKNIWLDSGTLAPRYMASPEWARIGPLWYFQRHTPSEAASALVAGLQSAALSLVEDLGVGTHGTTLLTGAAVLLLAAEGARRCLRSERRASVAAALAPAAVLFPAFAWLCKHDGDCPRRFLYPLAVSLLPMAAAAGRELVLERLRPGRAAARRALEVCIALAAVLALTAGDFSRDPRTLWSVPSFWSETSRWIGRHVGPEGFLSDQWSLYTNWDQPPVRKNAYPLGVPREELEAVLRARSIHHILVDLNVWALDGFKDKYGSSDAHGPTSFMGRPRCFYAPPTGSFLLVYADRCPP